jgi:hypothetical protein
MEMMMSRKDDLVIVGRTPESERWIKDGYIDKSDKELRALLRAFGVCPRCANQTLKMFSTVNTPPPERPELMPDEVVGFPICSQTCADGIMAAVTAPEH